MTVTKLRKVTPFYEYVEAELLGSGYIDRIVRLFMRPSNSDFWYTVSTNNIGQRLILDLMVL